MSRKFDHLEDNQLIVLLKIANALYRGIFTEYIFQGHKFLATDKIFTDE